MARSLEVLCETANDCYAAGQGGADRIELCAACEVGGLTPTIGMLSACLSASSLPIAAMLRCRPGGFFYSETEVGAMAFDAEAMARAEVQDLVFGALTADRSVDVEACRRVMRAAPQAGWVFHRAFDLVEDWKSALDVVIGLGFKRILTSGGAQTAPEGAERVQALIDRAEGRIEIVAGGGVRPASVGTLAAVGVTSFHASAWGATSETQFGMERSTDEAAVRALRAAIDAAS